MYKIQQGDKQQRVHVQRLMRYYPEALTSDGKELAAIDNKRASPWVKAQSNENRQMQIDSKSEAAEAKNASKQKNQQQVDGEANQDSNQIERKATAINESKQVQNFNDQNEAATSKSEGVSSNSNAKKRSPLKRKAEVELESTSIKKAKASKEGANSNESNQPMDPKTFKENDFIIAEVDGKHLLMQVQSVKPLTCYPWRSHQPPESGPHRQFKQVWWDPKQGKEDWTNQPKPHYEPFDITIDPARVKTNGFQLLPRKRIPAYILQEMAARNKQIGCLLAKKNPEAKVDPVPQK